MKISFHESSPLLEKIIAEIILIMHPSAHQSVISSCDVAGSTGNVKDSEKYGVVVFLVSSFKVVLL